MKGSWFWLLTAGGLVVAAVVLTQVTADMPGHAYLLPLLLLGGAWLILDRT